MGREHNACSPFSSSTKDASTHVDIQSHRYYSSVVSRLSSFVRLPSSAPTFDIRFTRYELNLSFSPRPINFVFSTPLVRISAISCSLFLWGFILFEKIFCFKKVFLTPKRFAGIHTAEIIYEPIFRKRLKPHIL